MVLITPTFFLRVQLLLLVLLCGLPPGLRAAADPEKVAALLDAAFFEGEGMNVWRDEGPDGFHPSFIPQFHDTTYRERIEMLDSTTVMNLTFNEHVRSFIRIYAVDRREHTSRIVGLQRTYFPFIEEMLAKYEIPQEMKYLAIVESALNPSAVSHANAKGMWQFIYGTGKMYGLESTAFVEDRFDPYQATDAACRHMRDLYDIYGDWFLVLAAYNSGAGNVNKAIRRSGGKRDYWEIWRWLPRETRGYVPAFIAVTYVMNFYREHNIEPEDPEYLYQDIGEVELRNVLEFDVLEDMVGVSQGELETLNPQYRLGVVPAQASDPMMLRMPKEYLAVFAEKEQELYRTQKEKGVAQEQLLARAGSRGASMQKVHVVRRGESLGRIARMYRCYVSQLIRWNNLSSSRIYPGQKLVVFGAPDVVAGSSGGSGSGAVSYHKVSRGQTLGAIARRYGVSVGNLKRWNGLNGSTIYIGQKLKLYGVAGGAPSGGQAVTHVVRGGETLGAIARRYRVSVANLREWNKVRGSKIYVGQKLQIYGLSVQDVSGAVTYHTVRRGETLGGIARRYGKGVAEIARWNSLGARKTIYPGQRLRLFEAVRWHVVRRGENLGLIAGRYGVSVSKLLQWNKIDSRKVIHPGQKLKILSQ